MPPPAFSSSPPQHSSGAGRDESGVCRIGPNKRVHESYRCRIRSDKRRNESDARRNHSDKRRNHSDKRWDESDKRRNDLAPRVLESDKRWNQSDKRRNQSDKRWDESDKRQNEVLPAYNESDVRRNEHSRPRIVFSGIIGPKTCAIGRLRQRIASELIGAFHLGTATRANKNAAANQISSARGHHAWQLFPLFR